MHPCDHDLDELERRLADEGDHRMLRALRSLRSSHDALLAIDDEDDSDDSDDSVVPAAELGDSVTLESLQAQLTRIEDAILRGRE